MIQDLAVLIIFPDKIIFTRDAHLANAPMYVYDMSRQDIFDDDSMTSYIYLRSAL